jgi:hypothetical protein
MIDRATLLCDDYRTDEGHIARLVGFFGIPSPRVTVSDFIARSGSPAGKTGVVCSANTFSSLLEQLDRRDDGQLIWRETVSSVFIYAGHDAVGFESLTRTLTTDPKASMSQVHGVTEWTVSGDFPDFSQSLSRLRITTPPHTSSTLSFNPSIAHAKAIVFCQYGAALLKVEYRSVTLFLSTASNIVDVGAALAGRNFDIREHFLTAAPLVMYLKWAFAGTCWQPPETRACLVIDDPLLKPRYGFLHFETFLGLMQQHNFSTSIAFIPWNWRRSSAKITQLFQANKDRYSLSIHGCDHTGGEFGTRHSGRLAWKTRQAAERMARHESRTGIRHDRVMVFPQGVFSAAAIGAIKRGGFIGAVNTELLSSDTPPPSIRISDAWDTAIMRYSTFPIYTRRYPSDGIENFAFDILLGKPCIVVIHHNDCRDRCRELVAFIDRLNALPVRFAWSSLKEIVQRGYRQRECEPDRVELEMFGTELRLDNSSDRPKRYSICKRESEPTAVTEVCLNSQPIAWNYAVDRLKFEVELEGGETKTISIGFADCPESGFKGENMTYRVKAAARRILSEFRDNYITRKPFSA